MAFNFVPIWDRFSFQDNATHEQCMSETISLTEDQSDQTDQTIAESRSEHFS